MKIWLLVPPTRLIPHSYMILFPIIVHWNHLTGFRALLSIHFRSDLIVIHIPRISFGLNRLNSIAFHFNGMFMNYNFRLSPPHLFKRINI